MKRNTEFDIAVLGGGSGGYAAARTAAAAGKKVVVIDGAAELGGLCILRGCMPSKALIESANRNLVVREAAKFGIEVTSSKVNTETVIERKRRLIKEFSDYRSEQMQDGRFELIRGHATFKDPHTLEVQLKDGGSTMVTAKTFIIATGSSVFVPDIPGLHEHGYLTSDDVLDMVDAPDSLVVLGGGAIALEMAHYFEAIDKQVTVIQRSGHLLTGMDVDLADELETALTSRTMKIECDTRLLRVEKTPDGKKRVVYEKGGVETFVDADAILAATGRKPNTINLGADAANIELNSQGGVVVGLDMQSSVSHIFSCGDVCSPYEIVHIAIEQGELAAENAIKFIEKECDFGKIDYRLKLYGIFTDPQVAAVGMTEIEASAAGREVIVETHPFNDHGKSMIHGSKHGFVKLIGDAKTKEILGGSVVGPEAAELIHEIVVAMAFHSTAGQLAKIPHYHPTLSEIWTYPAEEIADA
ncbi:dihydrolipoyl dehydrogenase family protein [Rubritalea profundi]|uniref:Dihydrolipoamide dehydrogenase n=1 Tax=Rubritalea profundi TaxID=1658618 RepID=A0A2S7U4R4_9BACT|nr:NAD(P)/FAD-dependent oxidoreductase [Rubritalea profundi]PQJ30005.1 dihydrolipoamide dehydrogenase [Rubritalea profundi]